MLLTLPQQQNPDEHLLVMTQLRKAVQALLSSWNQIRCKIKENISLLVCGKIKSRQRESLRNWVLNYDLIRALHVHLSALIVEFNCSCSSALSQNTQVYPSKAISKYLRSLVASCEKLGGCILENNIQGLIRLAESQLELARPL
eukprot:TRINITY_DN7414_c0_g1_i3.p1 TRINITY_DN7414_c0_g1~~TRINITY_DN7414_c0_g1_i3.p1  ORF type:complete len:144 (+),score=13.22 TRINITY_DN7414_c0_g1_i3:225-656(+)